MTELPTVSPEANACGECRACCITPGIPWMDKAAKVPCSHLCDAGCGVQSTKPAECASYECGWMIAMKAAKSPGSGAKREDVEGLQRFRPDRCGVIFQFADDFLQTLPSVVAMETRPGGLDTPGVDMVAKGFAAAYNAVLLLDRHGGEKKICVPGYPGSDAVAGRLEARLLELGVSHFVREAAGMKGEPLK